MACDSPISIKYDPPISDGRGGFIWSFPADCGKCFNCLKKRKSQWSYRLVEEAKDAFSAYFVTLTYTDQTVPYSDDGYTINKNDHFTFLKALKRLETSKELKKRDEISPEERFRQKHKIKQNKKLHYYGVSEYGDRTQRPHWHYILLNVKDKHNIDRAWQMGRIQIDECNIRTIEYVLKYMMKTPGEKKKHEQKEVSFMSKGIGLAAVDKDFLDYIAQPDGNHLVNTRGQTIGVPRYYKRKFLSEEQLVKKHLILKDLKESEQLKEEKEALRLGIDLPFHKHKQRVLRSQILENRRNRDL